MALTEAEELEMLELENEESLNASKSTPSIDLNNQEEKKSPWSALGAEITPQMKEQNPILSAIAQTGQDALKIPADFVNQFLFNAPRALLNKYGYSFPETTNPVAKTVANAAGVAGAIKNPVAIVNPILAGAVYGGLYSTPDNMALDKKSLINRAIGVTGGAFTGGVLSGIGKSFNSGDVINRFIGTRKKDYLFGRNPGQAVVDEKILAGNPEELSTKISDRLNEYGKRIEDILAPHSNKKINISEALSPLDEAINKAAVNNDQALVNRLTETKTALTNKLAIDPSTSSIQVQGKRNITGLSPQEATDIKRIVGEKINFTGSPSADKFSNDALLKVYGGLRKEIEKAVPEVAPLNQRYADLKVANIAIGRKDFTKTPFISTLGGVGRGAALGLLAGSGNPLAGVTGAVIEPILERATNNARTKTIQAMIYKAGEKVKKGALGNNQELIGIYNILNNSNNR